VGTDTEGTIDEKTRRDFLKVAGFGVAAFLAGCNAQEREHFLRERFLELDANELKDRLAMLSAEYQAEYGKAVTISATAAQPGVQFAAALDISRCIGCRRCVYACQQENNQSRDPQIQWIKVLEVENNEAPLEAGNGYYDHETVPQKDHFYLPVSCQQCEHPKCVTACPVQATWREPDGVVVIDYDWCIGCRCCMAACPYGARSFNWSTPKLPAKELNPKMHVLGNRPRPRGVVEKCHFCLHRTREGRMPACVEVCPVGARTFGNMADPTSELAQILANKRVFVLKPELKTAPRFFYYYGGA
jgi:Fe-S-cluster-containing dehydrogenase component